MSERRWRLVCYDVRNPKRYRQVFKIVRGVGTSVQYSVFRCRLDDRELERLRWELARVMAAEDALLVVDLCPRCAGKVIQNHVAGWAEPPSYRLLKAVPDQGSVSETGQRTETPEQGTQPGEDPAD